LEYKNSKINYIHNTHTNDMLDTFIYKIHILTALSIFLIKVKYAINVYV